MIPSTLDLMEKFAEDFPDLWDNAYYFHKISNSTLIIRTGQTMHDDVIKPCTVRWSMFDMDSSYLSFID